MLMSNNPHTVCSFKSSLVLFYKWGEVKKDAHVYKSTFSKTNYFQAIIIMQWIKLDL